MLLGTFTEQRQGGVILCIQYFGRQILIGFMLRTHEYVCSIHVFF